MAASQFVISRLFKSLPYNISLSKENRCRIYPCDPKELSFFCDNDHFYTQKCILKRLQTLKCHCNRHTRTHTQTVCNTAGSFARPCSNRFTSRVVRPHKCLSGCCPTVPARPGPARPRGAREISSAQERDAARRRFRMPPGEDGRSLLASFTLREFRTNLPLRT